MDAVRSNNAPLVSQAAKNSVSIIAKPKRLKELTKAVSKEKAPEREGKVVKLTEPTSHSARKSNSQRRRRQILWTSFLLCVALPIALVASYYSLVATDRYAARAGFSIRGIDTSSGIDGIGALTGLASTGSTTSDSYIVLDYLESRTLLESIDENTGLRSVYSAPEVDPLSRLATDATVEDFVDHWNRRIHTQFDPTSGIIEFEVQSFSANHALEIAEVVLTLTQTLVNDLSASARQDALRFARQEVDFQETRMRETLSNIRDFRTSEQSVNPSASAALDIELLSSLQAQLISIKIRVAAQREALDENAPSLVALRRQAEALEAQIAERRASIGNSFLGEEGASAITERLAQYESLEVERALAEQAYASSLNSLEQARRDADRQQRYLATHLRPQQAQESEYPKSLRNTLLIAFALFAVWGIGALMTYSVRDHLT